MTTAAHSVVIGVFRDHRLAEQAIEELKQADWGSADPQMVEKSAHGIFGAFKNARTERGTDAEPLPDELAGVDLPEEERQLYQYELAHGSSLVLAHPQGHLLEVRDLFHRYGAYHVFVPFQIGGEQAIPIRQEVPQVQKQVVAVGEIRIHKRVITEEKTFTVPVTREEVTIERLPGPSVSQSSPQVQAAPETMRREDSPTQTSAPVLSSTQEEVLKEQGIIRILVHEEQVFIQKQVAVIEEIVIQKQTVQDVRHLVEPVKHEEVRIERIGKAPIHEIMQQEDSSSVNEV